jgi:outer membrane protein OmpA-like peptidoglycan-associated protein
MQREVIVFMASVLSLLSVGNPAAFSWTQATPMQLGAIRPQSLPCVPPLVAPAVVHFASNSATPLPRSLAHLETLRAVLTLPQYAGCRIRISGHTDETGAADTNQRLSEQRAANVKHYLVEHLAIAPHRIVVQGYGAMQPRSETPVPAGQAANRRVEITLEIPSAVAPG